AAVEDVRVEALLLELGDLLEAAEDEWTGAVGLLLAYDAEHQTQLAETLRVWLDNFGDTVRAATAVHVHPNTFRYRLRRLAEVAGLDLEDADERFAAMLQLRLMSLRGAMAR
ncbi:helix-turn-helix domain-containing protein, partial [Streptomyces anulatus]|uniref:helix-turn-helix domain-containing protein n=1 Tax=Streptomyces anulatus TaxID=1892 RepID=UPI003435F9DB